MQLNSNLALLLSAIMAASPTQSAPTPVDFDISPRTTADLGLHFDGEGFDFGGATFKREGYGGEPQSLTDVSAFRASPGNVQDGKGQGLTLVRRDRVDDSLGIGEFDGPNKKEAEKKKLDLIKKIHDKEIKAAEVMLVQKISFFYEDKDDHVYQKKVDQEKMKKVDGGHKTP
ncbi:hypothetical protein CF319_g6687 [Tilletia indica]|nr:hypothetical protein CF319_g6687 [Tilletia indica]